ncbi:MAG: dihydroxyacetone kinase subunit DhaL [Candidatus Limnocylindria bacterium]
MPEAPAVAVAPSSLGTNLVAPARVEIDAAALRAYLHRCRRIVRRHAAALTRLDAALGDGDHGDNLLIGFAAVDEELSASDADDVPALLQRVGMALVTSVGGASGPLYGAAFIEAGFVARRHARLGLPELADMLTAGADGLARRGRCAVGDKTIYDALAPAADALRQAVAEGLDEPACVARTVRAAWHGMRASDAMVARRGLAMRLGERSRGHRDPGAASCFLLLRALALPRTGESGR